MPGRTQTARLTAILCADWGKEKRKRSVYVADVAGRTVKRVAAGEWSLAAVVGEAERWTPNGSVLVTLGAPLGVPESYLAAAARVQGLKLMF